MLISQLSFEKTFGLSSVFIESTLMENGGVAESANPSTLIKEAIHVIGCGYEEKTAWGKEVLVLVDISTLFELLSLSLFYINTYPSQYFQNTCQPFSGLWFWFSDWLDIRFSH